MIAVVVSIGAGVFLVANGSGGSKLFWAVGARVCKVANCSYKWTESLSKKRHNKDMKLGV